MGKVRKENKFTEKQRKNANTVYGIEYSKQSKIEPKAKAHERTMEILESKGMEEPYLEYKRILKSKKGATAEGKTKKREQNSWQRTNLKGKINFEAAAAGEIISKKSFKPMPPFPTVSIASSSSLRAPVITPIRKKVKPLTQQEKEEKRIPKPVHPPLPIRKTRNFPGPSL